MSKGSIRVVLVFFIALVLRLVLIFGPYHPDVINHFAWTDLAINQGLHGFYEKGEFFSFSPPNYPPLAIYFFLAGRFFFETLLSFLWWLNNTFPLFPSKMVPWFSQGGLTAMLKLPSVIADLGIGIIIFLNFRKRTALVRSSFYLFNPAVIYLSSVWGQIESLAMFFVVLSLWLIFRKKVAAAIVSYFLSLMIKPSVLIFLPVMVVLLCRQGKDFLRWGKGIIISAILGIILFWPFYSGEIFSWTISFYAKILPGPAGMNFLTANAFNFWGLFFGLEAISDGNRWWGISFRDWSLIIVGIASMITLRKLWWKVSEQATYKSSLLFGLTSFLFLTRMHERYLFLALPFFPLLQRFSRNKVWFIGYLILSLNFFLNLYHRWWVPYNPFLYFLLTTSVFVKILMLANLGVFSILCLDYFRKKNNDS